MHLTTSYFTPCIFHRKFTNPCFLLQAEVNVLTKVNRKKGYQAKVRTNPQLAKDLALAFTDVVFEDTRLDHDQASQMYHRAVFERERAKALRTRIVEILDGVHWLSLIGLACITSVFLAVIVLVNPIQSQVTPNDLLQDQLNTTAAPTPLPHHVGRPQGTSARQFRMYMDVVSVAIGSILVIDVVVRMFCEGPRRYFSSKYGWFDFIVTVTDGLKTLWFILIMNKARSHADITHRQELILQAISLIRVLRLPRLMHRMEAREHIKWGFNRFCICCPECKRRNKRSRLRKRRGCCCGTCNCW